MNHYFKSILNRLRGAHAPSRASKGALARAVLIGLGVLAAITPARAQVTPGTFLSLTNIPATMAANTASNALASFIPIRQNSGLALQWMFNGSAAVTANVQTNCSVYIYPSVDGTNATGTNAWTLSGVYLGTTNVVASTNWSAATLAGYSALIVQSVTNGTGGTLTNKQLLSNQWNPPRS